MVAIVTQGDARALSFPDGSIDLIVTSPPYLGLRSYQDGGQHYATQIGSEATPAEFIAALVACTGEMARVLKPTGSIFVNLGDKYGPDKSLRLLPERYRIACTDDLDLIARAVIVWSKPNGLPESVTDRVRRSHEDWVHLTKSPRYFQAVDEIREPHAEHTLKYYGAGTKKKQAKRPYAEESGRGDGGGFTSVGSLGKLPGSVWTIATQPLRVPAELNVNHFAAFPMEWPRRLITGWCPREVCTACGEGRRPVTERASAERHNGGRAPILQYDAHVAAKYADNDTRTLSIKPDYRITGYACACPDTSAPSTPGVVLDPFGGTGTTALVADVLGRTGISVDASADYGRIAQWRTTDSKQRARVRRTPDRALPSTSGPVALGDVADPSLFTDADLTKGV